MRYLTFLMLLGIILAGCSSASNQGGTASGDSPGNPGIASIATEGRFTQAAPTQNTTSSSPLPVMTVNSPPIVLTPIQGNPANVGPTPTPLSTAGWKTFSSASLGVAIDYPADWSVTEQSNEATFTSSQGAAVKLQATNTNGPNDEFRIGNQYCTSRTNKYNQTAEVCADNSSFTYSATFMLSSTGNSPHDVMLITKDRSAGKIYEAMIDSLRPTQ
jgi:hypothetical protein